SANPVLALAFTYPALALPAGLVEYLGFVSFFAFFLLFPNGRLVPRWMGLILLLFSISAFFNFFPSPTAPFNENWPAMAWLFSGLTFLIPLAAIIGSQIYRYRRVSAPFQRQQTKWIVLGISVSAGLVIVFLVIGYFAPSGVNANDLGGQIFGNIVFPIAVLLIPLSIGFSILRYRLYDIDVLINRTLVYGSLTVLLALLYVGLIFASQSLLGAIIKQSNNDVAIVVSTLAIAALFQPLRRRLQAIIDHRFYRRKYDAARTLKQFSATLRDEVDLQQLRESLLAVVEETMQPAHVSLWLRPAQPEAKREAAWTGNPPHEGTEKSSSRRDLSHPYN
ncbi:MAG TPA: hypothetical protein VKR42_01220, partial [Ktedonobacteraceae bacterium]|nr:hypothetical protein [Ktedonobacteraceae bacterium]